MLWVVHLKETGTILFHKAITMVNSCSELSLKESFSLTCHRLFFSFFAFFFHLIHFLFSEQPYSKLVKQLFSVNLYVANLCICFPGTGVTSLFSFFNFKIKIYKFN